MSIPNFPTFRPIRLQDKLLIDQQTQSFKPLAAIQFSCFFCWGTVWEISIIDDNIILKTSDLINDKIFYTLLGNNNLSESVLNIFSWQKQHDIPQELHHTPEEMLPALEAHYDIVQELSYSSYIYPVKVFLNDFEGLATARTRLHYFYKNFRETKLLLHTNLTEEHETTILTIFKLWQTYHNKSATEVQVELAALNKFFQLSPSLNLRLVFLYVAQQPIGFYLGELLPNAYCMEHFKKVIPGYKGAEEVLYQEIAKLCAAENCRYINAQEDLALPGLRTHKQRLHPEFLIHSYIVTPIVSQ